MNNIEILVEFIDQYIASYPEEKEWVAIYPEQIKAIENLIQEYKKLKKQMGKDLDVVYIKGVYDERNKWKNKVKEMLEHYKNTGYNELEEVLQELLEEGE